MTKRILSLWCGVVLLVASAACSRDTAAPTTGAAPEPGPPPRATISVVTHQSPGEEFWEVVHRGAETAADDHQLALHYDFDPVATRQADLVRAAVNRGVDGIAVTISDPAAMAPAVRSAVAADIPVVAVNSGIGHWRAMGALSFFGQDEAIAGRAAGERFTLERAQNVLCVIHRAKHVALEARCSGLAATFTGVTQQLYVEGTDTSTVKPAIIARLQQDRGIDRILTLAAPVAMAALQAVGEANSYARVATFDTDSTVVQAIKNGTIDWAVDQQPFLQGYLAVDALWLYVTNRNVIGGGLPTLTGPAFVDEANIARVADRAAAGTR